MDKRVISLHHRFYLLVVVLAVPLLIDFFHGEPLITKSNDRNGFAESDNEPTVLSPLVKTAAIDDKSSVVTAGVAAQNDEDSNALYGWEEYVDIASVAFRPSTNTDWCREVVAESSFMETWNKELLTSDHTQNKLNKEVQKSYWPKTGMYLIKIPKTGSSTFASIALQIAESVGARKGFAQPCPYHTHEGKQFQYREKPHFMWSAIRQPHRRTISSYFFFDISRGGEPYKAKNLIKKLNREKDYQTNYVAFKLDRNNNSRIENNHTIPERLSRVYEVFRLYDFIAVTERMDESMVVMKLLFGFQDEAMVVFNSKEAGGLDAGSTNTRCSKIQKSFTTEDVDKYLALGGDYRRDNLDYFLYAVANRSLDRTIDFLGRERVEREVLRHKKLRRRKEESCGSTTIWPCTREGDAPNPESVKSCHYVDIGCGHNCVWNATL